MRTAWALPLRRSVSCGVRSLIVSVLVVGILLSRIIHQARVQSECVAKIGHEFGVVTYDRSWYPAWIWNNARLDYISSVVRVLLRPRRSDGAARTSDGSDG